jgi:DNA repair exonuclease SbcCD ATPase subunit
MEAKERVMSGIFLSRVKIENFRTFGAFDISIPPSPGLTILTGTNGLGKSSFFDALEWGLTGKVRRFEKYIKKELSEGKYLTRRNAPPDSHKVSLGFTSGETVVRSFSSSPSATAVADLLKTENWAPIRDVGTYLAFTHFLGQAAQQRFTSRESPEQWEALKGPTGIERLEEIRQGLRGRATQLAFTRRIEQEKAVVDDLERRLADWQGWRSRLTRLQQARSATGAVSPGEIAEHTTTIELELAAIVKGRPFVPQGANLSERLTILDEAIAKARQGFSNDLTSVESMAMLPERYVSLIADARADVPALVRAREALSATRDSLADLEVKTKTASDAAEIQRKTCANLEVELELLEAARTDVERRTELIQVIALAKKDEEKLRNDLASKEVQLSSAEQAISRERDARSNVAQQNTIVEAARRILNDCQALGGMEVIASASASTSTTAAEAANRAHPQLLLLVKGRSGFEEQLARAEVLLEVARNKAGVIAAAVAQIATHIGDDDTNCPVCSTAFEPGQLRILADAAATSVDSQLAVHDVEVARLRSEIASINRQITTLESLKGVAEQAQLAADEDQRKKLEARAAAANLLQVRDDRDLLRIASDRDQDARVMLSASEAALREAITSAAGANAQYATLLVEIDELRRRLAEAVRRTMSVEAEQRSCSERLAARSKSGLDLTEITLRLQTCQMNLASARDSHRSLSAAAEQANSLLASSRTKVVVAERDFVQANEARQAAESSASAFAAQWSAAGLELPPSQGTLEAAKSKIRSTIGRIDDLASRQKELGRGNEASLLQQEIDEIEAAMLSAGGEPAEGDAARRETAIKNDLKVARAAHKLSSSARTAVNKFTDSLKKEAADFSTQFLAPLNRVIDDFNEAMLSTPSETIRFSAEHRVDATRFEMMLHYRDRVENATLDTSLPPQLVLSEGQLAANGFSILCAASTAYPWSRWRSLLLDDPLQHNDIIHTAAFVDVMRNMVEQQGYQLIMSSHDRAETDFITRKFDAAGIACSTITLTAPSADGLQFDAPVENRAAINARRQEDDKLIDRAG